MKRFVYICEDCFEIRDEDFWSCPECDGEGIIEMLVVENELGTVSFEFTAYALDKHVKYQCINAYLNYAIDEEGAVIH